MSESEQESIEEVHPVVKRGRPQGKSDSAQRSRRSAQEISDDKIKIARMKLDALMELEERKLANKKTRASRPSRAKASSVEESALLTAPKKEVAIRDESPPPKMLVGNKRQQLYDSWFPSSPRTRY